MRGAPNHVVDGKSVVEVSGKQQKGETHATAPRAAESIESQPHFVEVKKADQYHSIAMRGQICAPQAEREERSRADD